jgi:ADP-ribose pyrophosphatase YjhB (NUDIX family)
VNARRVSRRGASPPAVGARAPRRTRGGPAFPCARCGRPIRRTSGETPRKIACPRCGFLIYDYPRPCAGMLVLKGDSVLLLRRAHAPRIGWLDIPGGFMEAGESIEEAARRELREETGLVVGRAQSFGFYWDSYWLRGFGRFPTMNFYFLAGWRGGDPRAADDAAGVEWIPLARLGRPGQRLAFPHMREAFRDLRRHLRRGRP